MKKSFLKVFLILTFSGLTSAEPSNHKPSQRTSKSSVIQELSAQIDKASKELSEVKLSNHEERKAQLKQLELEFEKSVVGQEVIDLYAGTPKQSSLEEEVMNILQPVFGAIKETTTSLREKEDARIAIEELSNKKQATERAINKINALAPEKAKSQSYSLRLLNIKTNYENRLSLTNAQLEIAEAKLVGLRQEDVNPIQSLSDKIAKFVSTTGIHLIVSLFASLFFFFGVNFIFNKILQISESKLHHIKYLNHKKLSQLEGAIFLFSSLLSCILIFLLFLFFNNWLLISIYVLFTIILFWAIKDKITEIIEKMRLILNIGAVREQERIIYEGIPYEVEQIKFYTRLINSKLEGGRLRIPINALIGMSSRKAEETESFFPTTKGDWVLLPDEELGRVVQQTVEYIQISQLGGSLKRISTSAFLEMNPINLSKNGFRISVKFGIDYQYQNRATKEIEDQLEAFIKNALLKSLDTPDVLKNFFVEFASASASSLDYEVNAEFTGELAHLYKEIPCYLQGFAVDACNEYGWEIPFTQIKIHSQ